MERIAPRDLHRYGRSIGVVCDNLSADDARGHRCCMWADLIGRCVEIFSGEYVNDRVPVFVGRSTG